MDFSEDPHGWEATTLDQIALVVICIFAKWHTTPVPWIKVEDFFKRATAETELEDVLPLAADDELRSLLISLKLIEFRNDSVYPTGLGLVSGGAIHLRPQLEEIAEQIAKEGS